ncbi:bacillithiol biosynthesis cysteine-adding enzyme BshC [Domibacillus epiphyticus]|uniref:Putative cysteine ligase BshC n=1 Tax=Domibacillus epiphyticus TaxID=1714355 RepID=A0A1V2ABZ5_9BACI|nr:bacillithiol biosynthesis cysteine-adding enzyme BshC [Domibacillus epiphyticus]OMP68515.1 bacillithiol biosynthesis cysteine-adding enzyme BshC [Domibacillus epiphyticus]
MEQERISVPALNQFAKDYISGREQTASYFDYNPFQQSDFVKRAADLQTRLFERDKLAQIIRDYMTPFQLTGEIERSLEKLKNEKSVVVIGGQQAGLLTGPLYSIHKIISIIQTAAAQEKELGIPVVPVFWIAGEDHDLLEINHVYVEKDGQMQKMGYPERFVKKQMASETVYEKGIMEKWVTTIFSSMQETMYTNELLKDVLQAVQQQETFTAFFAQLTQTLFSKYGLLLIDAADPGLRKLEAPFFKRLIVENKELAASVARSQEKVKRDGYKPAIETGEHPANLFLNEDGERYLLEKDGDAFVSKSGKTYSEEELLQLLEISPQIFSNNVVSRPLMQEWIFPTLAFIAGPGEIAYWAELKDAFHYFDMNMPPVVPRVNITLIERSIAGAVTSTDMTIQDIIKFGVKAEKEAYIESVRDRHLHELVADMKEALFASYEKIENRAAELHKGLKPIVEKNKAYHARQIDYLIKKSDTVLEQTQAASLLRFDRIEAALHPGGPQERIWNLYPFLNAYGPEFLDELLKQPFVYNGDHYLVYI